MDKKKPIQGLRIHELVFITFIRKVKRLVEISSRQTNKPDSEVIQYSAIVFLVAIWQDYLTYLVEDSFNAMIEVADDPHHFPMKVLTLASKEIRENKDESMVWKLAGAGWKEVLLEYSKKLIGSFNTPNYDKVDILFDRSIGKKNISENWKWNGMTAEKAKQMLDEILTIRHELAHKGRAKQTINKKKLEEYIHFIHRLVVCTNNSVANYLKKELGKDIYCKLVYHGEIGKFQRKNI